MLNKPNWNANQAIKIKINDQAFDGKVCDLPFIQYKTIQKITMDIAIVGATGNVGRKTLEVLQQKNLNIDNLYLVASPNSAGKQLEFNGKKYSIENLENYDFSKAKITFFAAGGKISKQYAEKAAKHTTVIDNSSYFRMDPEVPLIVPQVNAKDIQKMK